MSKERRPTELRTPEFRVSYPSVFKPKLNTLADTPKYEYIVDALFPKSTDMSPFENAIQAAIKDKWGTKAPKKMRLPIKDGDEMENPGYADHYVITFKSNENYKPNVVGTKKDMSGKFIALTSEKEFYGGCFARAIVNAFAYDNPANKGVSFGLGNIQKTKDGERFGGGYSEAEQDFDDTVESEETDDASDFG